MKRNVLILIVVILVTLFGYAENSNNILSKSISKLENSKGINSSFSISGPDGNISGTFISNGQKFKLETPFGTTWFDGKSMWTLNKKSKQITLVNPTASEIAEVNPFAYLSSYKSKFKTGFSKRVDKQRYLVLLNPIGNKENIKAVEVAINKKSYMPERFIIRDKNDKRTTIIVNSLKINNKNSDTDFICPINKFKEYELVDLR